MAYANTGKRAQIVLVADYSNGADVILAKEPIRAVADLKGKKIGVEPMALAMFVLTRALQVHGLDISDVQAINLSQLEMDEGIKSGKIDAAVTYPPMALSLMGLPGVSRIFDSREIPKEIIDVISADENLLKERPDIVRKLRQVWGKAFVYTGSHRNEAFALMAEREGVSVKDFEAAMSGIRIFGEDEQGAMIAPGGRLEKTIASTIHVLSGSRALRRDVGNAGGFIARK